MIIDCISDLHGHFPTLEGGDLLIVAGDLTRSCTSNEVIDFYYWITEQKYSKKIFISGNHDKLLINSKPFYLNADEKVEYLCDFGTEFEGLKIWGSPWTKRFPGMNPNCMAFTVDTEEELAEKWALIPEDVDILVTHIPPYQILDELVEEGYHGGSIALENRLKVIRPLLHVFGHIHEAYGKDSSYSEVFCGEREVVFVNASHVNEYYEPVNKPIRIEL